MLWASRHVVFEDQPGVYRVTSGWLRAENGHIVEVGEGPPPEGAIDFAERLIAPAFINPHTHVALCTLRGYQGSADPAAGNMVENLFYRFEQMLTPEDVAAFAKMGAYENLLSGVGLVWDHYFHAEALADSIAEVGLAAVIAPTIQDLFGPGVPTCKSAFDSAELIHKSDDLAEQGIFACLGPHATDTVSEEAWHDVVGLCKDLGVPFHAHLAQSLEEVQRAFERHGKTPVEWLDSLGVLDGPNAVFAHAIYATDSDLARLDSRHTLIACPQSQTVFGFPARFDRWDQRGLSWSLATDAVASNDSTHLMKELRFASGWRTAGVSWSSEYEQFLAGNLSAADVWAVRTERYAANASLARPESLLHRVWSLAGGLHPKFRAGVIAPGALANVVVWDLEHPSFWPGSHPLRGLVFGDTQGAIHAMAVMGKTIGRIGEFSESLLQSQAYESARYEAGHRLKSLLDRL